MGHQQGCLTAIAFGMCGSPPRAIPPPASPFTHLRPCARQPDGSVHGNPLSYGPYDGMNVSLSMMLVDDGQKSWRRLCDSPQPPQACTNPPLLRPGSTCPLGHLCTGGHLLECIYGVNVGFRGLCFRESHADSLP